MLKKKIDKPYNNKEEGAESSSGNGIFIFIFLVGLVIVAMLFIKFNNQYKHVDNEQLVEKVVEAGKIISSNPLTSSVITDKKTQSSDSNSQNTNIAPVNNTEADPPISKCTDNCLVMINFMQDYLDLKNMMVSNQDITNNISKISSYNFTSDEVKQAIVDLSLRAKYVKSKMYFIKKFSELIKSLYKGSNQYLFIDLNDYFFFRKTGKKALEGNGLDKIVYEVSEYLNLADYENALAKLNNLSSNSLALDELKKELEENIAMSRDLKVIEDILLSQIDCNIVSQIK